MFSGNCVYKSGRIPLRSDKKRRCNAPTNIWPPKYSAARKIWPSRNIFNFNPRLVVITGKYLTIQLKETLIHVNKILIEAVAKKNA